MVTCMICVVAPVFHRYEAKPGSAVSVAVSPWHIVAEGAIVIGPTVGREWISMLELPVAVQPLLSTRVSDTG